MQEQDQTHYNVLLKTYETLRQDLVRVQEDVKRMVKDNDLEALADLNYVMKRCETIADDLRKTYKLVKNAAEKTICYLWVKQASGEPIRTEFCSASPDLKIVIAIPAPGRDQLAYEECLASMGVPKELINFGVVNIKWGNFVEYCTYLASQGKPLPKGNEEKTYNVYRTTIRAKRPILDDEAPLSDDEADAENNGAVMSDEDTPF